MIFHRDSSVTVGNERVTLWVSKMSKQVMIGLTEGMLWLISKDKIEIRPTLQYHLQINKYSCFLLSPIKGLFFWETWSDQALILNSFLEYISNTFPNVYHSQVIIYFTDNLAQLVSFVTLSFTAVYFCPQAMV